ncbi:MAG TPA: hypothetical protein VFI91_00890 [Longimicrobiaceae bacterium]|nr:hypothetical protein [Longimicrobiaceae bacterium]
MRLRSALPLLVFTAAACSDDSPVSPSATESTALFSCLLGEPQELAVGEVLQREGADAASFCLGGGSDGAEYVYVPFFASSEGTANVNVEVTGGGLIAVTGPPDPALAPRPALGSAGGRDWRPNERFHHRLREREIREMTPLIPAAQAARRSRARMPAVAAAAPSIGQLLDLNTSTSCNVLDIRTGRIVAISENAVVVADTANPAAGFSAEDFEDFALRFDTLVYPVNEENFGAPTDIDNNDRAIIFFTRAVNELTPPNSDSYIGGFFWAGDLFPREDTERLEGCVGSNYAEMFYLLAPDPNGVINGNVFPTNFVRQATVGVIGHEFQHLINASRRLYVNNAFELEEVWLNEGLSHIAEELLFYHVSGLSPRQNIDLEALRSSDRVLDAVNTYQIANLSRYATYLENPDEESLLGEDNLPTRGASWAFMRYTADMKDGPDAPFFFDVVNSRVAGVENLREVLEAEPIDLMQDWTVSVYTDDAVEGIPSQFTQPSWNFRDIMVVFSDDEQSFPLEVINLESTTETTLTLKGGGAAFLRFGVGASGRAILNTTSDDEIPAASLRISIVRTH